MRNLPDLLYHYTSISGVEGILSQKAIWASLLQFLNDSSEWKYTLIIVRSKLVQAGQERTGKSWPAFILKLADALDQYQNLNLCVFSMCEMHNRLSQWRSYCPAEGGYAIAFKTRELIAQLNAQKFTLDQCDYDRTSQEQKICDVVTEILDGPARSANQDSLDGMGLAGLVNFAAGELIKRLLPIAPYVKHPDFHEEHEWRAVRLVDPKDSSMKYHLCGSIVVPHSIIKLNAVPGDSPIDKLIVGPNAHQDLASEGLRRMASNYGVKSIELSTTPLRKL